MLMESPSTNPYAPPATTDARVRAVLPSDLRPLWLWLAIVFLCLVYGYDVARLWKSVRFGRPVAPS